MAKHTDTFYTYPFDSSGTEINIRREMINTMDGMFPEISKAQQGLLRKMRRDETFNLIPCPCVDKITQEPDRDRWCPVCLKASSQVATIHGVKFIRDILPGEYVLSGDNSYHLVTDIHGRLYDGIVIKIFSVGRGNIPIELTEDHPVFVFRPEKLCHQSKNFGKLCNPELCGVRACQNKGEEFNTNILQVRADQVKPGDYLLTPRKGVSDSHISKLSPNWDLYKAKKGRSVKDLPAEIEIDKDFVKFLGWYVAEGSGDAPSRKTRTVVFSMHEKEEPIAEELSCISLKKFGVKGDIHHRSEGRGICLEVHNAILSRWLHDLCGRYSDHKKTPDFIWSLPSELRRVYLDAFMMGDGHRDAGGLTMGITSWPLAEDVYTMAILEGYAPAIHFKPAYVSSTGQAHSDSWRVEWLESKQKGPDSQLSKWRERFFTEDYLFSKVKEVSSAREICAVYDISVDVSPSFVANGSLVHNCQGEGWLWDEVPMQLYKVLSGLSTTNSLRDRLTPPGLINVPLIVFYIRYDAEITRQDRIIELILDEAGDPVVPMIRKSIHLPAALWDYRSDNGKLEYWKAYTHEITRRYINAPRYGEV